jgi:hypothetical protein
MDVIVGNSVSQQLLQSVLCVEVNEG